MTVRERERERERERRRGEINKYLWAVMYKVKQRLHLYHVSVTYKCSSDLYDGYICLYNVLFSVLGAGLPL